MAPNAVYHAEAEGHAAGWCWCRKAPGSPTISASCATNMPPTVARCCPRVVRPRHPGFERLFGAAVRARGAAGARAASVRAEPRTQTCIDALKGKGPVFITGLLRRPVAWRMAQISPDLAAASLIMAASCQRCSRTRRRAARHRPFRRFWRHPDGGVEALIAKEHPTAQIFVYEAGHGFTATAARIITNRAPNWRASAR